MNNEYEILKKTEFLQLSFYVDVACTINAIIFTEFNIKNMQEKKYKQTLHIQNYRFPSFFDKIIIKSI